MLTHEEDGAHEFAFWIGEPLDGNVAVAGNGKGKGNQLIELAPSAWSR